MTNDYYLDPRVAATYDADHSGAGAGHDVVVDDIPFYTALARTAAARGQPVLELGCGTGRVAIAMAQAGADVIGIDNAAPMLQVARCKAAAIGVHNVDWLEADMARFALSASFGLVVIPFRSFQMLLTQEAQARCLACIYEHLVEGGLLAFNVANPAPLLSAGALSDRNGRALHAARRRVEAGSESPYGDSEPAHDHGFVLRIEPSLRLRYVSATAMRALLMHAGFTVEAVYGWFDGRPFESRSSEMVWLVNKA